MGIKMGEIWIVDRNGLKMMSVALLKEVILKMLKTDQCADCQKVFFAKSLGQLSTGQVLKG